MRPMTGLGPTMTGPGICSSYERGRTIRVGDRPAATGRRRHSRRGPPPYRDAPRGSVTPEIREALSKAKQEVLARLQLEEQILEMSLSRFACEGCPIEIAAPWFDQTLWFVPGPQDVVTLVAEGVARGRICTADELAELMRLPDLDDRQLKTLFHAKVTFGAEVQSIRSVGRREDGRA